MTVVPLVIQRLALSLLSLACVLHNDHSYQKKRKYVTQNATFAPNNQSVGEIPQNNNVSKLKGTSLSEDYPFLFCKPLLPRQSGHGSLNSRAIKCNVHTSRLISSSKRINHSSYSCLICIIELVR